MRYFSTVVLGLGLVLTGCSSSDDSRAPGNADTRLDDGLPDGFSALFVLGDSLSDVGNAAGTADYVLDLDVDPPTVGLCNPADVLVVPRPCEDLLYRKSRVSDGPVAVEHLAAALELGELVPSLHVLPSRPVSGTNYAIASAKARGSTEKDLERQVDALLLDEGTLPSDALYVVMIGGNDAIDALQAEAEDARQAAAAAGDNVTEACFDSETYRETSAEREFHPECAPAEGEPPRFDDFVFWDGIHPTGETHAAIGRALAGLL